VTVEILGLQIGTGAGAAGCDNCDCDRDNPCDSDWGCYDSGDDCDTDNA